MNRKILFDPDLVIPRGPSLTTPSFWVNLIDWIDAAPGARMGSSTYIHFIDNLNSWLEDSGLQPNSVGTLMNRVATAVFELADDPRLHDDCRHVCGAYSVDDRRDLLVGDLSNMPKNGIDIATVQKNWEVLCSTGKSCRRCKEADIALKLAHGALPTRNLGENVDGEITRFPISNCIACLQDSRGNHYAEDPETNLWWTRDNDCHGGVVFKTYTKTGKSLKFDADRDASGKTIVAKHKGPKRAVITLGSLSKCTKPNRHSRS